MAPTLENHEQRITVLEERMDQEAGLRASQDRDLSEMAATLKTQKDLLQALATTQSEHTQKLSEHTQKLDRLERGMGRLEGGMGRLEGGMQQIVGKLDVLIARERDR